jgi:hypothetical protein
MIMTDKQIAELQRQAPWICCPWCDEDKCVGRDNCNEIKRFIQKRLKERE